MSVKSSIVKLSALERVSAALVQSHLITLGLLDPPVDGIAGPNTHRAWARFKTLTKQLNLDSVTYEDLLRLSQSAHAYSNQEHKLITKKELQAIYLRTPTDAQVTDLNRCLADNDITTPIRLAHFLAQTGHESGGLRWLKELASGAAYNGRRDLGNTQPGDGPRFKGAGVLQLTGRANYQSFANYIKDQRVMEGCDYVAENYPFSSAGWFWTTRKLNARCDRGDSVSAITLVVNGGLNGLQDRISYFRRAQNVLDQRQSFFVQSVLTQ